MQATNHVDYVNSWLKGAAGDIPAAALLQLFERTWGNLWRRSESAVGEIVLVSIAGLIRAAAAEKYPFLAPLNLDSADISCKELVDKVGALDKAQLQEAVCFVLSQFLSMIGDLTDQILTPGPMSNCLGPRRERKLRSPS